MVDKILTWFIISSQDPAKFSLAFRGGIVLAIPMILYWTGVTCKLGVICFSIDASSLQVLASVAGDIVLGGLTLIGAGMSLWGWIRKIYRTVDGTNLAINPL